MAKGVALLVKAPARNGKFEADAEAAVAEVVKAHGAQIRSPQGWYGTAVVRLEGNEERKLPEGMLLVKVEAGGFRIYSEAGFIANKVEVKTGKFQPVKA